MFSPGNLSIASGLRTATVQQAFDAQRGALRQDPVGGTIAVARTLSSERLSGAPASGGGPPRAWPTTTAGRAPAGFIFLVLLGIVAIVVVGVLTLRRKASRNAVVTASPESLDPLVDGLAAQIADLDDDMQMPGALTTAARPHYDAAVLAYGEARDVLAKPKPTVADVQAAGASLETGLRAARRTRAVLEGRPPEAADQEPLLEGMCSFDPKHGKATTTVTITTPTGDKAELPACANCAAQMAAGEQPQFREVEQNGRRVPYWADGPDGDGRRPRGRRRLRRPGARRRAGRDHPRGDVRRRPTPRPQAVRTTPARGAAAEAATSAAAAPAGTSAAAATSGAAETSAAGRRGRRGLQEPLAITREEGGRSARPVDVLVHLVDRRPSPRRRRRRPA